MSQMIGVILAILLGMMSLPQLMSLSREANNNMVMSNVAQQATQFNDAVTRYVTTYATEIEAVATATEPAVIPVTTLKNVGLLPASFHATTPWGGTFAAQVLQPSAGNLEVLATTSGGESLPDNKAVKIANLIGQAGGFIPLNDTGRYSAGNAYGTGWGPLSTTNYTVTGGQLASLITFNQGQLTDNRLYRNAVPGQPQLNQMNTPLNMRAQATENTSDTLCIVGDTSTYGRIAVDSNGAVLSCQLGIWKRQGSGYWKDPVATFANLPTIDNNVGDVRMVTGLSRGFTWNGSSWVAIAVDQNGNLTIPGTATINALNGNLQITSIATEGAACSGEGRIAASSAVSGLILSCQSSVWRRATQGTGLSGILQPLAGKTIRCSVSRYGMANTYLGTATMFGMIDANGYPFVRIVTTDMGDTGWVSGTTASISQSSVLIYGASIDFLVGLTGSTSSILSVGQPTSCSAAWPMI